MSEQHPGGGSVGSRAVVIRGGSSLRTERRTVVDETDRTLTVDDGTRFARDTRYDVAAIIDELTALHPDLGAIPEDLFWAVVDKHTRDEDRDLTP